MFVRLLILLVGLVGALTGPSPAVGQVPGGIVQAHQYGSWTISHVSSVLHVQAAGVLPVSQSGVWTLAHVSSVLHVAGTGQGTFPATQSGSWTVAHVSAAMHIAGTVGGPFYRITQTFTATGNGTVLDATNGPVKSWAIQVTGTGATPTSWDVRAEGGLNNVGFTQVVQHTTTTGDGITVYSGATLSPSLYLRIRVAGLVLGGATNIVVVLLGMQ